MSSQDAVRRRLSLWRLLPYFEVIRPCVAVSCLWRGQWTHLWPVVVMGRASDRGADTQNPVQPLSRVAHPGPAGDEFGLVAGEEPTGALLDIAATPSGVPNGDHEDGRPQASAASGTGDVFVCDHAVQRSDAASAGEGGKQAGQRCIRGKGGIEAGPGPADTSMPSRSTLVKSMRGDDPVPDGRTLQRDDHQGLSEVFVATPAAMRSNRCRWAGVARSRIQTASRPKAP